MSEPIFDPDFYTRLDSNAKLNRFFVKRLHQLSDKFELDSFDECAIAADEWLKASANKSAEAKDENFENWVREYLKRLEKESTSNAE
jgi:hypothetical protein